MRTTRIAVVKMITVLLSSSMHQGFAMATTLGYWRFEEGVDGQTAQGAATVLDSSGLTSKPVPSRRMKKHALACLFANGLTTTPAAPASGNAAPSGPAPRIPVAFSP